MALLNQYVLNHGQLGSFFDRIREAQAPDKFTHQFLKDLGFTSSNYRAYVPLMKGLGFLAEDGSPRSEYMELLDATQWKSAISKALRKSYSDIFTFKAKPAKADKAAIQGKYKTTYNLNDLSAERAASTFLALLDLADEESLYNKKQDTSAADIAIPAEPATNVETPPLITPNPTGSSGKIDLCYNIQIHLPPTKDIEVYNAIFKSLREHFVS